jgi:adenine-specific DNA-methyltransferase
MREDLCQHMTPAWIAEMLIPHYFPRLDASHFVWEPTCGDARMILAIPEHVPVFGSDIDPELVARARRTLDGVPNREIALGDFRTVELPRRPSHVIGNPPFIHELFLQLLERCNSEMDFGGQCGFILPAYFFQTAKTVVEYKRHWSLAQDLMPRDMFKGLESALVFARFTKERETTYSGFLLYDQVAAVKNGLRRAYQRMFIGNGTRPSVWRDVILDALAELGGRGTIDEICQKIEGKRPTENPFWRPQIRKVVGKICRRVGPATYALEA